MVDQPLPNQELERSDSDQSSVISDMDTDYIYVVRLTPLDRFTEEDVTLWLQQQTRISAWVLSIEEKPKKHFHLVITISYLDDDCSDIKPLIREFLFQYWPAADRTRGWGNKQYNCQLSTDIKKAVSYAIKEKVYTFDGFDPDFIKDCEDSSFTKNSPKTFAVEFQELKQQFMTTDMEPRVFMIKFIQLKAKYSQMVNPHHAYQYMLSMQVQKDPSYAEEITENYLYKV